MIFILKHWRWARNWTHSGRVQLRILHLQGLVLSPWSELQREAGCWPGPSSVHQVEGWERRTGRTSHHLGLVGLPRRCGSLWAAAPGLLDSQFESTFLEVGAHFVDCQPVATRWSTRRACWSSWYLALEAKSGTRLGMRSRTDHMSTWSLLEQQTCPVVFVHFGYLS